MSASPSLAHFVRRTAEKVPHPTKPGLTLWDAGKDNGVLYGDKLDEEVLKMYQEELQAADSLGVGPLGSGSDYTVFLQRIGVSDRIRSHTCLGLIITSSRWLAPTEVLGRRYTTLSITIIACLTANHGKRDTLIRVSFAM